MEKSICRATESLKHPPLLWPRTASPHKCFPSSLFESPKRSSRSQTPHSFQPPLFLEEKELGLSLPPDPNRQFLPLKNS